MNPGELIRDLRKDREIGVRELARSVSVSPTMITGIENGTQVPGPATAKRIFHALDMAAALREVCVTIWGANALKNAAAWENAKIVNKK